MSDATPQQADWLDVMIARHRHDADVSNALADALENGLWMAWNGSEWMTPAAVAEILGTSIQSANNRMRRLVDLGIMRRRSLPSNGRSFEYRWMIHPNVGAKP